VAPASGAETVEIVADCWVSEPHPAAITPAASAVTTATAIDFVCGVVGESPPAVDLLTGAILPEAHGSPIGLFRGWD
jgi:hypothetical protein